MSTSARRRRRRTALVLTGLVAVLLAVFVYAAAYYRGWLPGDGDTAQQTTTAPTAQALQPGDVTVNVYNASGQVGLARRTADALTARGFTVDAVDNDPEQAVVAHSADIRYGEAGKAAASLLRRTFPDAELVKDARESAEVDLVLGTAFEELPAAGDGTDADATTSDR